MKLLSENDLGYLPGEYFDCPSAVLSMRSSSLAEIGATKATSPTYWYSFHARNLLTLFHLSESHRGGDN